ncbi:MAG: hypothetical protein AAFZ15_00090 [Bacteroidota bacterium]
MEVTLTGTPPFLLTNETPFSAGQTARFPESTGILEAFVPGNAAVGSYQLEAMSLKDANCICE